MTPQASSYSARSTGQRTWMMMPVMNFIGNLGNVAVTILGGYLAIRGSVTVGDIQAFIQYVCSFTQPISQLANTSNVL